MTHPPVDGDDDRAPRRPGSRLAGHRAAARRARQQPEAAAAQTLPSQQPAAPASAPVRSRAVRRRPLVTAGVVALVIAAAALGAFALLERSAADQLAHARTEAVASARQALPLVFSYDYQHLDADFAKAKAHLTGDFAKEYADTTKTVVSQPAMQYKVVVAASIAKDGEQPLISVVQSSRNRVVLLAFIDQVTQSTRLSGERVDHSRVRVTMARTGGTWKISAVDAL